jgi:glycosyltransferase involved in cell wall biosynthesis/SAM-dependent methyltransferase
MDQLNKPRILFLCDKKGWAFDIVAHNLMPYLAHKYDFTVQYVREQPTIDEEEYDIIYVFFWGERYHRKFVSNTTKIVKEISSHRWEKEEKYGKLSPIEAYKRYMTDAFALVTTSVRLFNSFENIYPTYHYPLGVDSSMFEFKGKKPGPLKVGWAGNIHDAKKGVSDILLPACQEQNIDLQIAGGDKSVAEMVSFYQQLDVICVAATEEGTPLPLLEAMACGCFPICTDVGVVPEVITNSDNGIIVERSVRAFSSALSWCKEHTSQVREKGHQNSDLIRKNRGWKNSALKFDAVIQQVLKKQMEKPTAKPQEEENDPYFSHFIRINPGGYSDKSYGHARRYFMEDLHYLLPSERNANILEIGTGFGHLIRYLIELKYQRVSALDMSSGLLKGVRERYADQLENIILADARKYLPTVPETYDTIIMMDVIEHMPLEDARNLLQAIHKALRVGGKVIMRTPNMGNIMGQYSFYQDITHAYCYTDWSIIHLLEQCGFSQVGTHQVNNFASNKRKINAKINRAIHNYLYRINDKVAPKTVSKNLMAWGIK